MNRLELLTNLHILLENAIEFEKLPDPPLNYIHDNINSVFNYSIDEPIERTFMVLVINDYKTNKSAKILFNTDTIQLLINALTSYDPK